MDEQISSLPWIGVSLVGVTLIIALTNHKAGAAASKKVGIVLLIGLAILTFWPFFKETDWTAVLMGAGFSIIVTYLGGWLIKALEGSDKPKSAYWWAGSNAEEQYVPAAQREVPVSTPAGDNATSLIYLLLLFLPIIIPYRIRHIADLPGSPWHTLIALIPAAWIAGPVFRYFIVKKIAGIWSE